MKLIVLCSFSVLAFLVFAGFQRHSGASIQEGSGSQLYTKHCVTCHQADGKGVRNMFPPLSGNAKVTGNPEDIIKIVLFGLEGPITVNERDYNMAMPPQSYLTDKQIADILTYIRNSWENKAPPVTAGEVLKIRKTEKPKPN